MTTQPTPDCVFCPVYERPGVGARDRVYRLRWPHIAEVVTVLEDSNGLAHAVAVPLGPIVPGHRLVIPEVHVPDAAAHSRVAGGAFEVASKWGGEAYDHFNLITNVGKPASQSVFHLHVHIIPRSSHDGLQLPWTGQRRTTPPDTEKDAR